MGMGTGWGLVTHPTCTCDAGLLECVGFVKTYVITKLLMLQLNYGGSNTPAGHVWKQRDIYNMLFGYVCMDAHCVDMSPFIGTR